MDRPGFEERRGWLLDTLRRTIASFAGVDFAQFDNDWDLQKKAVGCLVTIGQDIHQGSGIAAPKLAERYKDVRNRLSHDYMRLPNEFLWAALQDLPLLLESVEQHTTPPVKQRS